MSNVSSPANVDKSVNSSNHNGSIIKGEPHENSKFKQMI